eukprot:COSAG05_NODE_2775_length_2652_cov_2.252252_3_plen_70_part_00
MQGTGSRRRQVFKLKQADGEDNDGALYWYVSGLTAAAASEIGDQSQEPDVGNDTGKTLLQARIAVSERS